MQAPYFGWRFHNSFSHLPELFFTRVKPTPVVAPQAVLINDELGSMLGLNTQALRSEQGIAILAGNQNPAGAEPLAQAYAGHQFGYFTMLGDGRAILLGEQLTPTAERYDLQLKGCGKTPYSGDGDGRAVLGPMLREYLISEAMHNLRIPTTRSLAVVTTGETVLRDKPLPGAIMLRVARSHIRVGTFQYAAAWGTKQELQELADYTIKRHYPELYGKPHRYRMFLREVIKSQASLISQWMLVGFIHGVMNTDNMAISGETIDYGPCAFMDSFDPTTVFSFIDQQGRYAYGKQPQIASWNLARFADSLQPLLHAQRERAQRIIEEELQKFTDLYNEYFLKGMRNKLGLSGQESDQSIINDLLRLLQKHKADFTNTFLDLTFQRSPQNDLYASEEFRLWKKRWQALLAVQNRDYQGILELMKESNPALIPRNHHVEEVLRAAVQDRNCLPLEQFLTVLKDPFAHSPEQRKYAEPPPPSAVPFRTFCGT